MTRSPPATTGAATRIGAFGPQGVTDIAPVPAAPGAVPEPAPAVLLGAGALGPLAARRRRGA